MKILFVKEDDLEGTWTDFFGKSLKKIMGVNNIDFFSHYYEYNNDKSLVNKYNKQNKTIEEYREEASSRLFTKVRIGKYDAIVVIKGELYLSDVIKRIHNRNILTVLWQSDDPWRFNRHSNLGKTISSSYDLVYTSEKNSIHLYEDIGVKAKWLPFACAPDFRKDICRNIEPSIDLTFLGEPFLPRVRIIDTLRRNKEIKNLDFKTYGKRRGAQEFGEWEPRVQFFQVPEIITRSKINLAFSDQPDGYLGLKLRHFEIPGYNRFMLAQNFDYLDELFEIGKEIEAFDTINELLEKIEFYNNKPNEIKSIAQKGHNRVLSEHTYNHRSKTMLTEIEKRI